MLKTRQRAIWLCLLLVVASAGYYYRDLLPDFMRPSESNPRPASYNGQYAYQRFWPSSFGPDVELAYHLEYACGHDQLLSGGQLTPDLLSLPEADIDRIVRTMQLEAQDGMQVILRGRLPTTCKDCQSQFIVSEQDGCVAVYHGNDLRTAVLVQRYEELPIGRLPEMVQQQVRAGITVHTQEELMRVLESLDR